MDKFGSPPFQRCRVRHEQITLDWTDYIKQFIRNFIISLTIIQSNSWFFFYCCLSIFVCLSFCLYICLPLPAYLCLSVLLSLYLSTSACLSLSVCPSVSISVYLCLSIFVCCLSFCLSLSFPSPYQKSHSFITLYVV